MNNLDEFMKALERLNHKMQQNNFIYYDEFKSFIKDLNPSHEPWSHGDDFIFDYNDRPVINVTSTPYGLEISIIDEDMFK